MFEHFSESARRIVFWARYEAGRLSYDIIEAQHLLLGFLQEDQGSYIGLQKSPEERNGESPDEINRAPAQPFFAPALADKLSSEFSVLGPLEEPALTSVDMPLGDESRAVLKAAAERANGSTVTPLHILLGLLLTSSPDFGDGGRVARSLLANGVTRESIENAIRRQIP